MRNIVRLARLLCRAWVGMPFHLGPLYLSFFLLASLVMTETFCSSLSEVKIIDPDDIDEILIQPGRELLTLVTCHPYASGGLYRYVVYCERVPS